MPFAARLAAMVLPLVAIAAFFALYVGAYVLLPLAVASAIAIFLGGRRDSDALEALTGVAFAAFVLLVGCAILVPLVYEGD